MDCGRMGSMAFGFRMTLHLNHLYCVILIERKGLWDEVPSKENRKKTIGYCPFD